MVFASLQDVKRILRLTDTDTDRDAQIQAALDAIHSWAEAKIEISKEGANVEVYFDVSEDATLHLPAKDCVVTLLKVYEYPSSAGVPLSPIELGVGTGWTQDDQGQIKLRPTLEYSPFEGAQARRRLRAYERVVVHYEGTGAVPRAVTEGVAMLAAGWWQHSPIALSGLTSERIGDYSYTLEGKTSAEAPVYVRRGMWLLRDFLRKSHVSVV